MNVFGGVLESACLSVHPCVCVSLCVSICLQNTSLCESACGDIKYLGLKSGYFFRGLSIHCI